MADLDFKVIGLKIKQRRQELGITQEYIANALDVNPSHISNIECGRANPSLTALIKIANILSCSVDYFISDEYTFEINKNREKTLDDKIIDKTVKEWLKPYQKILSDHDYNEFSEMIFSVVSMAEQTGFENGVRFAVKMLYSLLND